MVAFALRQLSLQQVAAAVGTAVVVTVMASRQDSLLEAGRAPLEALMGGMRWGFGVGPLLAVLVVAVAFAMPGRPLLADAEGAAVEDEPSLV